MEISNLMMEFAINILMILILYKTTMLDGDSSAQNGVEPIELVEQAKPASGTAASFSGRGYLRLPKAFSNWLRAGGASLEVTTTTDNGLVLYHGGEEGSSMEDSEFVALAVQDGYMELRYQSIIKVYNE